MSKRSVLFILCAAVLCAAASAYLLFLSPSALKSRVTNILHQYISADISLGKASIHPIGGLSLSGLTVRKASGGELLFSASKIRVRPRLLSLLKLKFRVAELIMENAELSFNKDASGRSNWAGILSGGGGGGGRFETPVFHLRNGNIKIDRYTFRDLNCDLTPFAGGKMIALRGTVSDPFWGHYGVSGHIDRQAETVRLSLDGKDLDITDEWVKEFPVIGRNIRRRYRPSGIFDLTGSITFCWRDPADSDYSLVFTGKDVSLQYLVFPITKASGRLLVDPHSVIVNHLAGSMLNGAVDGYSIINLKTPSTYFNRYNFQGVDMRRLFRLLSPGNETVSGKGSGYVYFQGDRDMNTYQGKGEINVPNARFWKFPLILAILSKLQFPMLLSEEPVQNCTITFSLSEKGIRFEKISLVSNVLDIYGNGWAGYDGKIDLSMYARPVSKTPILFADLLLQEAIDSLSGNLAQFKLTGTLSDPQIALIPLTPLSKNIVNFFDSLTRQRQGR